jgi:AraC-like DNA-binding protein
MSSLPDEITEQEFLTASVADYVQRRHTDPTLCVADAARRFKISVRTVTRALDAADTSWRGLLIEARMGSARRLLESTTHLIDDVARMSGYDSAPSFARAFRAQHNGLAPAQWRVANGGKRRACGPTGAARKPAARRRALESGEEPPPIRRFGSTASDTARFDQATRRTGSQTGLARNPSP